MENRKPKYKLVEVEWFDAQSGFGMAQSVEECIEELKPIPTFSIGYLLHEDNEKVMLGFMLFGEDMVKHNQMIPRGMVKKITELNRDLEDKQGGAE